VPRPRPSLRFVTNRCSLRAQPAIRDECAASRTPRFVTNRGCERAQPAIRDGCVARRIPRGRDS
jgi:hypothetical protein